MKASLSALPIPFEFCIAFPMMGDSSPNENSSLAQC